VRIDGRFLNWGVFFILLGAVPLLVQANTLDRDVVARSWQLWPLLIIGGGVGLLLRRSRFDFAGGLVVAATFGLMFGGLLAVGTDFGSIGRSCGNDGGKSFATQQGTLPSGDVNVQFNCGDLTIGTAAGTGWSLAGTSNDGGLPRIDATSGRLDVRTKNNDGGFFGFGSRSVWTLTVPADPTLNVDVQLNAGSGTLGFGGAHLGTLHVQGNAGSTKIDLSESAAIARLEVQMNAGSSRIVLPNASLTGNFEVNAGSVAMCSPAGVGLHITFADSITGSNNFGDQGLTKNGSTWETANYASAANRISLTTSANAGSITLNPKEGCS
jgi:hypothetical protein